MSVYKDEKTNTWKVYYRYTDWQGKVHQTTKRGFQTKREALAWEREQLNKVETDLDMSFESFIDIYTADMKNRIKENTWHTKFKLSNDFNTLRRRVYQLFIGRFFKNIINLIL